MDGISRHNTVTYSVIMFSCLLQMRLQVSYLDMPYLLVIGFKYAICATVLA